MSRSVLGSTLFGCLGSRKEAKNKKNNNEEEEEDV